MKKAVNGWRPAYQYLPEVPILVTGSLEASMCIHSHRQLLAGLKKILYSVSRIPFCLRITWCVLREHCRGPFTETYTGLWGQAQLSAFLQAHHVFQDWAVCGPHFQKRCLQSSMHPSCQITVRGAIIQSISKDRGLEVVFLSPPTSNLSSPSATLF